MKDVQRDCFCAFCKAHRKVYVKKHVSIFDFLVSLLFSVAFSYLIWSKFEAKVLLLTVVFLMFCEMYVQLRWRTSMICPYCKFDPVLYLKNPKKVAENIKVHLEESKDDPEFQFLYRAKMRVPVKKVSSQKNKNSQDLNSTL